MTARFDQHTDECSLLCLSLNLASLLSHCHAAQVGLRVVVVYLAWFDRDSEKPGAYELVEPVIYMLCGCALSGTLASKYWEIPDTNTEKVVTSNR